MCFLYQEQQELRVGSLDKEPSPLDLVFGPLGTFSIMTNNLQINHLLFYLTTTLVRGGLEKHHETDFIKQTDVCFFSGISRKLCFRILSHSHLQYLEDSSKRSSSGLRQRMELTDNLCFIGFPLERHRATLQTWYRHFTSQRFRLTTETRNWESSSSLQPLT
jgi:hypothetical protein